MPGFRVAITTLGCKVNQADSDALADAFRRAGCRVVDAHSPADAYVVNTCTVTLVADRKARKLVRGVAQANPQAVVAVTGCYAEGAGRTLFEQMPEVDVVRGTRDRAEVPEAVLLELRWRQAMGLLTPVDSGPPPERRVRAMLKVQDGCNHVCGYCIVPSVRGRQRSRTIPELVAEAEEKVAQGVRELVVCGIRVGAYGWDFAGRRGSRFRPLLALLEALAGVEGLRRLRLSSILPLDVGPDLFRVMADLSPVCEHFHLPLQSGDDGVLRRMGRGYTTRRFRELAGQAREAMPGLCLATDVLVGYPGETAEEFDHTLRFCREVAFGDMHVFPYSVRPGTRAAELADDVPVAEKQARVRALLEIRDELRRRQHEAMVGRDVEVLVEERSGGRLTGLSRDYLRVEATGAAELGALAQVRIDAISADGAGGRLLGGRRGAAVAS
ncbi:MAG: tRNA (N(6)-L-threonylcarbamoyladenosine(37)-C(2))-methylthiotransferase MtaB [Armatimonadetes bacterium]|nr:tRNA (N(6)-L-threonylcarbamoyladenosine(37)-C(2))-methylthiotransferase MtaB [Armatimonadota bacterium]